ncbi:MHS family proline/betaine transporter-like MFS transporter [Rhodoligotrophos appendicifer]|uniref:MFS transporter n=1 Tax=Rhodoligotrophos appendicifer TaxID=987056 RepID=UPI001185D274|nr:MFS transporter [Rhodoligotrophos appendicifer]
MVSVSLSERVSRRKVVAAGMVGNILEWYDFAIYGYFAAAIGRHFFPSEDPVAQLISAFGIFAVGYIMRPIGGAIVGQIGDKYGRRTALTVSVAAMAIPTFLMGLLPGYETLGLAAPILLTLLRMIQGLSVGGEYTSSMVFLVENAPEGRRGVMGGFTTCGAVAGILLGSAVATGFATVFSTEALEAWGWRLPFLLGLLVGLAGYLLRRQLVEEAPIPRESRPPFLATLRTYWQPVAAFAGMSVFNAVSFYTGFVYLVSWLQIADGIAPQHALAINSFSMVMLLPLVILGGMASDRFGRKPVLMIACGLAFIAAIPTFWLLYHPAIVTAVLGQLVLVVVVGLYGGGQPAIMVEGAPAEVRCTVVSIGYNISFGIIGGLTPLVATWLVERTANQLAPAFLIMAAAAISAVAVVMTRLPMRHR